MIFTKGLSSCIDAELHLAAERSAKDVWPEGIGAAFRELGNKSWIITSAPARGVVEGLQDKYFYGRRPNPSYVPRYRNLFGDKRPYLRGFGYEGGAGREGWSRAVAELGFGGTFKDAAAEPGQWTIGATAFGEMRPNHENKVTIARRRKTSGDCRVPIDAQPARMRRSEQDMTGTGEMTQREGSEARSTLTMSISRDGHHEMGTARMGATGRPVINSGIRFGAPNVSLRRLVDGLRQGQNHNEQWPPARAADMREEIKSGICDMRDDQRDHRARRSSREALLGGVHSRRERAYSV